MTLGHIAIFNLSLCIGIWFAPQIKAFIISTFRQVSKWWRTLFPRTIREHEQVYCSICDGRIWFWQSATRLYSLGMTRCHIECAARYLREELETRRAANHRFWTELEQLRQEDQRKH